MNGICQEDIFPMKGNYIYYNFEEQTNNTKHCIKYYSSFNDSTGTFNGKAQEFTMGVQKKCQNMNELKVSLTGLKNTMVAFMIQAQYSPTFSCTGELTSPSPFVLGLPTGAMLLEDNLLFSLFTAGKFKVTSQVITATIKVKFESKNKYSLIISNFKIKYTGTKGNKIISEELNLEDVYSALQEKGKQSGKMYDKGMESMKEIDKIIRGCAKVYQEELKRIYEIDEL